MDLLASYLLGKNGEKLESLQDFLDVCPTSLKRHFMQQFPNLFQFLFSKPDRVDVLLAVVQQR